MVRSFLRTALIPICVILLFSEVAPAAIGVYEWRATTSSGQPPVLIQYRLNCAGSVSIEIIDQAGRTVDTLGPFNETAGLQSHTWDGSGISGGIYRARITASDPGSGTPGTLIELFSSTLARSIYGLAIDRFAESPGYGTIYVSKVCAGGRLRAYRADGSPKTEFGTNGELSLGFSAAVYSSPYGVGVDRLGNIYVACSTPGLTTTGVKVFDYQGHTPAQYHVFPAQAQGIFWLDGLDGPQGPEIYESIGDRVRACAIGDADWHAAIPAIPGTTTRQICFETSGQACYVATNGAATDPEHPNPGVSRYIRQPGGEWVCDTAFDCGLSGYEAGLKVASERAVGVSCDARVPDAASAYGATSLWMGLDTGNGTFGGNIVRKNLADGTITLFPGPDIKSRFVAADAVGNVAIEHGVDPFGSLWSWWGLYAPSGEPSTDTRTTAPFTLAGSASPEVLSELCELRARPNGALVELSVAKTVTAAYDGCFYIGEMDGLSGLKVKCTTPVSEGDLIRLGGTLGIERGERVLQEVEVFNQ